MQAWDDDNKLNIDVRVDLDWAKSLARKSTSEGVRMTNGTVVKDWSGTPSSQKQLTGLRIPSLLSDLGLMAEIRTWTGSTATKATVERCN